MSPPVVDIVEFLTSEVIKNDALSFIKIYCIMCSNPAGVLVIF